MAQDAFDRWWEWFEKPVDSPLTIPAYLHDAAVRFRAAAQSRAGKRDGTPRRSRCATVAWTKNEFDPLLCAQP
jgi:hypothetical protein